MKYEELEVEELLVKLDSIDNEMKKLDSSIKGFKIQCREGGFEFSDTARNFFDEKQELLLSEKFMIEGILARKVAEDVESKRSTIEVKHKIPLIQFFTNVIAKISGNDSKGLSR